MAQTTSHTDEALMERMAKQDQEALSSLYDRYRGVVFSLALRILRDRAEAEEVMTDVFFQSWKSAGSFDPLRGSVAGWLITLCRSRAIDRLRARGRRDASLAALAADPSQTVSKDAAGAGPEESTELRHRSERILAALGALTTQQRGALELAYYSGLSHSEIAEKLGEPLGTVKTWIRQALLTLKETLGSQIS